MGGPAEGANLKSRRCFQVEVAVWIWSAFAILSGTGCHVKGTKGLGAGFVPLYPVAERSCRATASAPVLGQTVTVHYDPLLGEKAALAFLKELGALQTEREQDYQMFRSRLRAHLGDELFKRIEDRPYLRTRALETTWFLMLGEQPTTLVWRGPKGSTYHFLPAKDGPYSPEQLRVHSTLIAEVHEITHWVMWNLVTSRRGCLPRWLEEGTCDYMAMHFRRWKQKEWDGAREVMARLTWHRPAVRRQFLSWRGYNDGFVGRVKTQREPLWESELLYRGSLGFVIALESELGSGGLLRLYKKIFLESPETDEDTVAIIEEEVGKPIDQVGLMSADARQGLLTTLLERATGACRGPQSPQGSVPLSALGHFYEWSDQVTPALEALASCERPEVAVEGITGLRFLGRREVLRRALERLRRSRPEVLEAIGKEGLLDPAEEFARARVQAARWFDIERKAGASDPS